MVKIRLARRGRKKLATYDVIVADVRSPRDGKFIEKLGTYNPLSEPATIKIDDESAFAWLMKGAQPSDTVKRMLSYRGILFRKHLQLGVIKGAITQEQADAKLEAWKQEKESKVQSKVDRMSKDKHAAAKARYEAETKIREARAEAIRKKAEAAAAAAVQAETSAEAGEEAAEETPAAEA